jgi:phosphoribosyl 1,2-cyclic phosphodiesterase
MARRMHVPVYVSSRCRSLAVTEYLALNLPGETAFTIEPGKPVQEGVFSVDCFYTSHDSAGSCGYTISVAGRRFTIITDTGVYDSRMMDEAMKADVLFLESNHDIQMLRTGPYPLRLQKRVAGDKGHLSNDQARGFLLDCGYDRSRKPVCLIHLSDNNNDPALVADAMKDFNSVVCERGRQYDFSIART